MNGGSGRLDLPGVSGQSGKPGDEHSPVARSSGQSLPWHSDSDVNASCSRAHSDARAQAYKILSVRARTEKELRDALSKKGHDSAVIDDIVGEMIRCGYIDDVDAAHRWAAMCVNERRHGAKGIAMRLVRRGIDPDLADEAARSAYSAAGLEEFEVALELAEKRVKDDDLCDDKARLRSQRRVAGFLARRGFRSDTIARVVRELFR